MAAAVDSVGILGIGVYLPDEVRTNDWWTPEAIDGWRRGWEQARTQKGPELTMTPGMRKVEAAVKKLGPDPFQGSRTRRVMAEDTISSDMEAAAAKEALARANVDVKEVKLLLSYSEVTDYLVLPNAPKVHHALGLPRDCVTLDANSVCTSLVNQMILAEQMIRTGQTRYALLVQSMALTKLLRQQEEFSPLFGDAATAVVLGPCSQGLGLLAHASRTDGSAHDSLVCGVPGKRWWQARGAPVHGYIQNRPEFRRMFLSVPDLNNEVVDAAVDKAGLKKTEVDFYAAHQQSPYSAELTREHAGLVNAKYLETFTRFGNMGPCNVPFVLSVADREGLLRRGDTVVMSTIGAGYTWACTVARWEHA